VSRGIGGYDGWRAAAVEIAGAILAPPERAKIEAFMSRRQNAKYKIDRRVGENVWGRPKSPINSRQTRPGQHGARRSNKPSDFGIQLMAKQKLKGFYGDITEKQFRKTYEEAARRRGNTAEFLVGLLESRLDTVVYRAKFVPTIFAARQFVNHGHVTVNGKKANISSMSLKPGDVIQVRERSRNMALLIEAMGSAERDVPEYVEVDTKAVSAKYVRMPGLADIPYAARMEPNLVVEFYSS
jgi:small subunit ribosomal protein S4